MNENMTYDEFRDEFPEMVKWMNNHKMFNRLKDLMVITRQVDQCCVKFHTMLNVYSIYVRNDDDGGYMGCTMSSRRSRPGENWVRGCDFPDGPYKKKTWNKIIQTIAFYEFGSGWSIS